MASRKDYRTIAQEFKARFEGEADSREIQWGMAYAIRGVAVVFSLESDLFNARTFFEACGLTHDGQVKR